MRAHQQGGEAGTVMPKRTEKQRQVLAEYANDEFVKRARQEGWRSRAVFKLKEIQQSERLLRPGHSLRRFGRGAGRLEPVRGAHRRRREPHRGDRHPAHGCDSRASISCRATFANEAVLEQVLTARRRRRRSTLFCRIWPPTWQA